MSKEELRTNLYEILDFIKFAGNRIPTEHYSWDNEKYDWIEALETALEQEPCEDAISRQSAIFLASNLKQDLPDDERLSDMVMAHNEGILEYQTQLSLLPPVTPQPKIGHWIMIDKELQRYKCSECGEVIKLYKKSEISKLEKDETLSDYPFSHCGAKMESEDKE